MTDLVLLINPGSQEAVDADRTRDLVSESQATVASVQVPTISGRALLSDDFVECHHQYGLDLASIGDEFRLRDIVLVKTPKDETQLNFVLLHVWNWPESTYDIDEVRVPYQKEPDPRNNPIGKNPGNIWAFSDSLNDREVGQQTQLFDPETPDTVADGHLERGAINRLVKCHSNAGDTVRTFSSNSERAKIEEMVVGLGRDHVEIDTGRPDPARSIPVLSEKSLRPEVGVGSSSHNLGEALDDSEDRILYRICDCREGIESLEDGSIKDVVTSPPYNIAYDPFNVPKPDPATGEVRSPLREEYDDEMPAEQYHALLETTFDGLDQKMDRRANAFINIKNNYNGGDCRPPFWLLELVPDEWQLNDILVWRYDISYDPAKSKYKPYYEWVFHFAKGGSPNGAAHEYLTDHYIPIVKGNSTEREGLIHPAMYPLELVKTCLEISDHDGLVVDPFLGSGTTLAAARELGRPGVGFEKESKFEEDIQLRIRRASPTL